MGWGIGIGIGWPNASAGISYAKKLIKAFKERVLSYPNSIFEAEACLDATLTELNAIGLLKEASLVITPNAYNEGILYDVVPNTTLGDMTVVRATTATRVNSAGLVEVVPRNLLTYSERFENANWIAGGSGGFTVTTNATNSPNETLTADKLIAPLVNQTIRQNAATINTSCTLSIYLKTNSGTKQMKLFINDSEIQSTINVTTDWQRFTLSGITGSALIGSGRVGFSNVDILNESSFVYAWGAQFESFPTATEYFPTTTRLNIPRIDYTNGSCPSILVEPQRTNLALYSNDFTNSIWTKTGPTITPNTTLSPDGNINASTLTFTSTNQLIAQSCLTAGTNVTGSFYLKGINGQTIQISVGGIDFLVTLTSNWQRFTLNRPITTTTSININTFGVATARVLQIYGFQAEIGSYPTSYIPTVASIQTRNADIISKTGISSLINSQEGVIYFEGSALANNTGSRVIELKSSGGLDNNIYFRYDGTNNLVAFTVFSGAVLQCNINYSLPLTQIANNKMAFVWALNRFEIWVNGSKVAEDTLGIPPASSSLNNIIFYDRNSLNYFEGKIKLLGIYKEALSITELIKLTTL
jgi:hypothetical protein